MTQQQVRENGRVVNVHALVAAGVNAGPHGRHFSNRLTNRRIATELALSARTVDGHIDHILSKLEFASRAQIAAWWATNQASAS